MKKHNWSDDEKQRLRELYPLLGLKGVVASGEFPGRTRNAIRVMAATLDIVTNTGPRVPKSEPAWGRPYIAPEDSIACRLLAGWRGPVNPNLGLRP